MRVKNQKERIVQSKKRALEDEAVDRPSKRVRTDQSRMRTASNPRTASRKLNSTVVKQPTTAVTEEEEVVDIVQKRKKLGVPISQSGRFGRAVQLPTRFR